MYLGKYPTGVLYLTNADVTSFILFMRLHHSGLSQGNLSSHKKTLRSKIRNTVRVSFCNFGILLSSWADNMKAHAKKSTLHFGIAPSTTEEQKSSLWNTSPELYQMIWVSDWFHRKSIDEKLLSWLCHLWNQSIRPAKQSSSKFTRSLWVFQCSSWRNSSTYWVELIHLLGRITSILSA